MAGIELALWAQRPQRPCHRQPEHAADHEQAAPLVGVEDLPRRCPDDAGGKRDQGRGGHREADVARIGVACQQPGEGAEPRQQDQAGQHQEAEAGDAAACAQRSPDQAGAEQQRERQRGRPQDVQEVEQLFAAAAVNAFGRLRDETQQAAQRGQPEHRQHRDPFAAQATSGGESARQQRPWAALGPVHDRGDPRHPAAHVRVVEGVDRDSCPPAVEQLLELPLLDLGVAAGGLEVVEDQVGVVDVAAAGGVDLEAVVDVVEVAAAGSVESPPSSSKTLARGHQAGGGHGEAVAGDQDRVGVAAEVAAEAAIGVAGEAVVEADADVLQAPVAPEQAAADGADAVQRRST